MIAKIKNTIEEDERLKGSFYSDEKECKWIWSDDKTVLVIVPDYHETYSIIETNTDEVVIYIQDTIHVEDDYVEVNKDHIMFNTNLKSIIKDEDDIQDGIYIPKRFLVKIELLYGEDKWRFITNSISKYFYRKINNVYVVIQALFDDDETDTY